MAQRPSGPGAGRQKKALNIAYESGSPHDATAASFLGRCDTVPAVSDRGSVPDEKEYIFPSDRGGARRTRLHGGSSETWRAKISGQYGRALLSSDVRCYECLVKGTFSECAVTGHR